MKENIDLTKILKDCPKGTKLYSTIYGEVEFDSIEKETHLVTLMTKYNNSIYVMSNGKYSIFFDGECTLFPSRYQRDWSKFKPKKPKFDPKSLKPFDKVLVRDGNTENWVCNFFSHIGEPYNIYMCISIMGGGFKQCIPYNDKTQHLVGTNKEAPEYYRYWEV